MQSMLIYIDFVQKIRDEFDLVTDFSTARKYKHIMLYIYKKKKEKKALPSENG